MYIIGVINNTQQDTYTSEADVVEPEVAEPHKTAVNVTVNELYGNGVPVGTYVKVTGKVLQADDGMLRIENSAGDDIMITGDSLKAYEGRTVTVEGTFVGPTAYDTVMGSTRTVPGIKEAKII